MFDVFAVITIYFYSFKFASKITHPPLFIYNLLYAFQHKNRNFIPILQTNTQKRVVHSSNTPVLTPATSHNVSKTRLIYQTRCVLRLKTHLIKQTTPVIEVSIHIMEQKRLHSITK
jgi:hypothetical protein